MNSLRTTDARGRRFRSLFMLFALLGVILGVPLMAVHGTFGIAARILYTAVFCVAGYLLGGTGRWVRWYIVLAVPTLILAVVTSADMVTRTPDIVRDCLTLAMQTMLITVVVKYSLLNAEAPELDRIIAGICGYLILALLWADIYSFVDHFSEANAFAHSGGDEIRREDGSLLYFSLVTLTTLGYGDITPQTPLAKMLSALEAAVGTLYLAVLIASLISGLRAGRKTEK